MDLLSIEFSYFNTFSLPLFIDMTCKIRYPSKKIYLKELKMTQWKKVTAPKNVIPCIGEAALEKFLAGEIFITEQEDQQTHKKLKSFTLYENRHTQHLTFWPKEPINAYLLMATYTDGSRGIFYNNMPLSPIKLDEKNLSNCWESSANVSEVFCYDTDRNLLIEFINLLNEKVQLNEQLNEICAYFNLDVNELNRTINPGIVPGNRHC